MSIITLDIKGIPEVQAALKTASAEKIAQIRNCVNAAALNVQGRARKNAPVNLGFLRSQIRVSFPVAASPVIISEVISGAPYSEAVEYGTKPHDIYPRNAKTLAGRASRYKGTLNPYGSGQLPQKSKDGSYAVFGKHVHHPGTKAHPYMYPALEAERPVFLRGVEEICKE